MVDRIPLSCIPIGTRGEIIEVKNIKNRERLMELGFTENTEIIPLHKSIGGDPGAYFVRGAVMALRNEDADNIICIKEES